MIIEGNMIMPDDGMILTNGETFSKKVYLGIYDAPENWQEIPEEDQPEEITDSEALDILTGRDADEPENGTQIAESN